jgi:hypothetical protein
MPPDLFPLDDRLPDSRLSPLGGESLAQHLDRLARTAGTQVLDELRPMSAEEFHRPRARETIDVSAAWVVFHLIDHEVEHRGSAHHPPRPVPSRRLGTSTGADGQSMPPNQSVGMPGMS